jgi:hypothetical protein
MADYKSRENRAFAYEIKCLLDADTAARVRTWARSRLQPDPNTAGGAGDIYRTTSLYYDTFGFDVFHRRGSFGRCKYRIRRYAALDTVFLERKLRKHGIVTKRRTLIPLADLDRLSELEPDPTWDGRWFHARMIARAMAPACQVAYSRTALQEVDDNGLIRLTLDEDLRAWRVDQPAYVPNAGGASFLPGRAIMEMKFRYAMPAIFSRLLEEFGLTPQAVSKYHLAVRALGCVPCETEDANSAASSAEETYA